VAEVIVILRPDVSVSQVKLTPCPSAVIVPVTGSPVRPSAAVGQVTVEVAVTAVPARPPRRPRSAPKQGAGHDRV